MICLEIIYDFILIFFPLQLSYMIFERKSYMIFHYFCFLTIIMWYLKVIYLMFEFYMEIDFGWFGSYMNVNLLYITCDICILQVSNKLLYVIFFSKIIYDLTWSSLIYQTIILDVFYSNAFIYKWLWMCAIKLKQNT